MDGPVCRVPDRGIGRTYHPFTDAQLSAARRKEFAYPGSSPAGMLPSFTAAPPPAIKEHRQYLDQTSAGQAQAPGASAAMPPFGNLANPNSLSSGVADWIASMASVDPKNLALRQQSLLGALGVAALGLLWFALGALAFAASTVFRHLSEHC